MPTRMYLIPTTPDISPTAKYSYQSASSHFCTLSPSPSGSATSYTSPSDVGEVLAVRAVSPPLAAAVTVSGDLTGVANVRVGSGTTGVPFFHVYITQGNSTTAVRGTFLSEGFDESGASINATLTGRSFDTANGTNVNAQVGDRIVVECAMYMSAGSNTVTYSAGGTGSDQTNGGTNMNNPMYLDFDSTFVFGGASFRAFILE